MFNPFAEDDDRRPADAELVERAKNGERAALEKLVLRHQAWIYNIAVRMVFRPQDAEEVTQEVLVKVITKLSMFKGESTFRTWLYRIAANHVLNMKRRWAETQTTTFADYGAAIDGTPDRDLPDPNTVPVEVPLLVEEAKIGCTMGMLLCTEELTKEYGRIRALDQLTLCLRALVEGERHQVLDHCITVKRHDRVLRAFSVCFMP